METRAEMFAYLYALRKTGVTNMFGAGAWLQTTFDLDRDEAREVLLAWMKDFQEKRAVETQKGEHTDDRHDEAAGGLRGH